MNKYIYSRGRRKTSSARVKLMPGTGKSIVNGKNFNSGYFANIFELVGQKDKYSIEAIVKGGGVNSQIGAIRLAIARCLVKSSDAFKSTIKKNGLLTRDSREKERKKPGLKRARRAPQWSKR